MDSTNKVMNLQFADYTPVSATEKIDRSGWVNFGANNLFPQYLRELSETSPVHGSLCISISDMIAGKGLEAGAYQARVDSLDVYSSYYGCAHDWKKFGGYYLEIIYSTDRKTIAKINHIPFEECRIAIEQSSEEIIGVYHSEDWGATKKKRNKPVFIPQFNGLNAVQEPRQVYWCFNYTSGQVYPRPDYWSAVNYIELSKQIGIYHVNNIMNGLFPSFIVSFFVGAQDPEAQRKIANDWENKLSGARNAGKFIMTFNESETQAPQITPFPITDADKQYEFLSNNSRQEIMVAHRITTPLLFGIREQNGFGSNTDEMVAGLKIFMNQVIEPAQRKLTTGFEEILAFEIPNIELSVVQNTPISIEEAVAQIAPTTTDATAVTTEETNVAATALNGAQITSLVEILVQTATGVIPKESARGVVAASFPTLTSQQIDAIFDSIVVGSVNPTEVAMGALILTMSELEKKKVVLADNNVADWLIQQGQTISENYIMIDAFEVDYDTDDQHEQEIESLVLHEFATRVIPPTRVNQISEQDKRVDEKLFMTRYRYRGVRSQNTRPFCKKMLNADLLYRKEDIVAAENKVVNSGWGAYGEDTYSCWLYKGGGNCNHFWQKEVYMSYLKSKVSLTSKETRQVAVKKAEQLGYKVRNEAEVAKLPVDMDYHGFLASNPVWGRNGSAYKKK
jgi:hypothetical protein